MKKLIKLKKLLKIIRPSILIGGLEISDSYILYVYIDKETQKTSKYSVSLPPDVVKNGSIINQDVLSSFLKELYNKIPQNLKIPSIVSISDSNIYTQIFSTPYMGDGNMDDAVILNLEMVSPIDIENSYYGWQYVGDGKYGGQQKVLASFIDKKIVDPLIKVLNDTGFFVVAIEQKAASLARILEKYAVEDNKKNAVFMLSVDGEGISFSIIKMKYLYFNRFISWDEMLKREGDGKQISLKRFQDLIINESYRVVNYYANQFGDRPQSIYLISKNFEDKLNKILNQEFHLPVRVLNLKKHDINSGEFVAFGSALRGLTSRTNDEQISLAPEGVRKKFLHMEIISFMKAWNVAISSVFLVILLTSLGVFIFMNQYISGLKIDLSKISTNHNSKLLADLSNEAKEFNKDVSRALVVKNGHTNWADMVAKIYGSAGSIIIDRFYIQSLTSPISINAKAAKERDAIDFKQRLEKIQEIRSIDLPLSAITPGTNGGVLFRLSFIKK